MDFIRNLSAPPKKPKKDLHYWADYIELLCLVNKDGLFSQADFMDRIKGDERDIEDSEDYQKGEKNIDINERVSLFAEDCFKILEYRVRVFAKFYPFTISQGLKSITLNSEISIDNKKYLFLLFSSTLNYFIKQKAALTSSFELISLHTLKRVLPGDIGKAYLFGSSNIEQLEKDESKKSAFLAKLKELAAHLKETVLIDESKLSQYNNGDGGLDLVGWIDLGDNTSHFPLFFCQCACTPNWTTKQNSSAFNRWNNYLTLSTYPLNFIFIPYDFRGSNGDWHEAHAIEKTVLFDRLRLLLNFQNLENCFETFEAYSVINNILKVKESVV